MQNIVPSGKRLLDGDAINDLANFVGLASIENIIAHAGGGRTDATPLENGINVIETVTTAADSVLLPVAHPGTLVFVSNLGANATQIFARGSDTIDGTAGATGISLAANRAIFLVCGSAAAWGTQGASSSGDFSNLVVSGTSSFGGPITVTQNTNTPKAVLQKVVATTANAPTALGLGSTYLRIGGGEWTANSYRLIGLGYFNNTEPPAFMGFEETSGSTDTHGDLIFGTRSVTSNTVPTIRLRILSTGQVNLEDPAYVPAGAQSLVNKAYVDTNALRSITASQRLAHGEATFTGTGTVATGLTTIGSANLTIKVGTAPGVGTSVVTYTVTGATLNFFAWKPTSNTDPTLIAATDPVTIGWHAIGT